MATAKVRIAFDVPVDLYETLERLGEPQHWPVTTLVRVLINEALAARAEAVK